MQKIQNQISRRFALKAVIGGVAIVASAVQASSEPFAENIEVPIPAKPFILVL